MANNQNNGNQSAKNNTQTQIAKEIKEAPAAVPAPQSVQQAPQDQNQIAAVAKPLRKRVPLAEKPMKSKTNSKPKSGFPSEYPHLNTMRAYFKDKKSKYYFENSFVPTCTRLTSVLSKQNQNYILSLIDLRMRHILKSIYKDYNYDESVDEYALRLLKQFNNHLRVFCESASNNIKMKVIDSITREDIHYVISDFSFDRWG